MGLTTNRKKKPAKALLWLLGAVALLGLAFFLWPHEDTTIKLRGKWNFLKRVPTKVSAYLAWADSASVSRMDTTHNFTAMGLNKMADALEALAEKERAGISIAVTGALLEIRIQAYRLQADPESTAHAKSIKGAFQAASRIVTGFKRMKTPAVKKEVMKLNKTVGALSVEDLTLNQKQQIIAAFKQVSAVLEKMSRTGK